MNSLIGWIVWSLLFGLFFLIINNLPIFILSNQLYSILVVIGGIALLGFFALYLIKRST
jgi:hypothetical protein